MTARDGATMLFYIATHKAAGLAYGVAEYMDAMPS